jgi:hypothetical protein
MCGGQQGYVYFKQCYVWKKEEGPEILVLISQIHSQSGLFL